MDCIILAAGYATRLYPVCEKTPKPLLPVCGRPLIEYLMEDIDKSGEVERFVVVSNHKFFDCFEKWARESAFAEKTVVIDDGSVSNETRLGAVADIAFAVEKMDIKGDTMVIAGDNLLDFSLVGFIKYFKEKRKSCIMRYFEPNTDRCRTSGVISFDGDGRVTEMEEKPENPKTNWLSPPFYIYCADDIAKVKSAIEEGCPKDAPGSFAAFVASTGKLYAMEMPGSRYDIGTLANYENIKNTYKPIG